MSENTVPVQSGRTLVKASGVAGLLATVVLTTFILPAEYNIDPTGVGAYLGLTALTDSDVPKVVNDPAIETASYRSDEVTVVVPPNRGVEYKFQMEQYGRLTYEWRSDGEVVFFDFHGEPEGDTTGFFESYTLASASEMKGTMTMPFAGSHGWYWKNNSNEPVQIILKTQGEYQVIGLKS